MSTPQLNTEEMRDLAEQMARVSPDAAKDLRWLIAGSATAADSLAVFRRHAKSLLHTGEIKATGKLRTALLEWVSKYGGRTIGDGATTVYKQSVRWTPGEFEAVEAAAKRRGVSPSEYVRMAATLLVQHDMADQRKAS